MFPLERQLLAAARPLARSLLDIPLPSQAVFADIQRLSENLIAMNEILRDRERCTVRLVDEPRQDGDRRGDAHVHVSEPLRLSDRRRDRQPDLPVRGRRLLRRLAARAGGASRAGPIGVRAGARCCAPRTSTRRCSARTCSTGSGTRCSARAGTIPPPSSTTRSPRSCACPRTEPAAAAAAVRAQGRYLAEEDRTRADRRRRRPAADDHPALGDGGVPADVRHVRGRRARGHVPGGVRCRPA